MGDWVEATEHNKLATMGDMLQAILREHNKMELGIDYTLGEIRIWSSLMVAGMDQFMDEAEGQRTV